MAQDPGGYCSFSNDVLPSLRAHSLDPQTAVMKLIPFIIPLTAILPAACLVPVKYDSNYDNPDISLTAVACSGGMNGLIPKGYKPLAIFPIFPILAPHMLSKDTVPLRVVHAGSYLTRRVTRRPKLSTSPPSITPVMDSSSQKRPWSTWEVRRRWMRGRSMSRQCRSQRPTAV